VSEAQHVHRGHGCLQATVEGVRIFGSPYQPVIPKREMAFQYRRGSDAEARWNDVPAGLHLLITHGPPHGIRDRIFIGKRYAPAVYTCGLSMYSLLLLSAGLAVKRYARVWTE